jgi:hypothetical protein
LARLAVGGTWGSMRQAEINAAACGSNSASGSPPSLPLAKKLLHICKQKNTFEKKLIKRGKCSRVGLCFF